MQTKIIRGTVVPQEISFVMEECCNCGIPFFMPSYLKERLLRERTSFYCPNGHGQHYTGKNEEEKLRQQLQEQQRDFEKKQQELTNRLLDTINEKNESEKKLKRLTNGVCPCCNRMFANLMNHMKEKHPEHVSKKR